MMSALLKKGDTVGLITPAGFIDKEKLQKTIENLASFGLKSVYFNSVLEKTGYLAGNDQSRLNELHTMYENTEVNAIISVRGGYGTTRILDNINFDIIKKNPKPFIGFSDITALINAVYKKTGIPGFHGVIGAGDYTKYTAENFERMFFSDSEIINYEIFKDHKKDSFVIHSGDMSGDLAGGNLALVVSTIGTQFDFSWKNKIVFLEDVGEAPYKTDRMLTQLISSGKFNNVKGIILGQFRGCEPEEDDKENSFSLKEVILDRIKPLKIPAVYGFSFGHIKNQLVFPVGIKAKFNTEKLALSIKRKDVNRFFV